MPKNIATQMHQLAADLRGQVDAADEKVTTARRRLGDVQETIRTRADTQAHINAVIDRQAERFRGGAQSNIDLARRHLPELEDVSNGSPLRISSSPLRTFQMRQNNLDVLRIGNDHHVGVPAMCWFFGDQIKAAYAAQIRATDWPPAMDEAERQKAIDTARQELAAAEAAREALVDEAREAGINIV